MASVALKNLYKNFGQTTVVRNVNVEIDDGEFLVFVGPSGCGKTTTLRMVVGLESISEGDIYIGNNLVNDLPPGDRDVAMVFQNYALYSHMTVSRNLGFALKARGVDEREIINRVQRVAKMLDLEEMLERKPRQLSGGQRQRVALGRAVVRSPKVFLMDEPLSNLDALLRLQTRKELIELTSELKSTVIYVTHDQVEAMTLADRIVVLNSGRIEQVGTPLELYNAPANRFVAEFIGSPKMNILHVVVQNNQLCLGSGVAVRPDIKGTAKIGAIGIRPEHLVPASKADAQFSGPVTHIEHLGEYCLAYLRINEDETITVKLTEEDADKLADHLYLRAMPDKLYCFDSDGTTHFA